jgi:poly-gamma-glutamate capsule biosynthesis protein CapA/YwtB (metallophosphatase superfamily)
LTEVRIALAGDTMLGRSVATMLSDYPSRPLVSEEIVEVATSADLFVLNLECCISERGSPWRDPGKRVFFRAPPSAIRVLQDLGVSCVTLANNHALDFDVEALLDTVRFLDDVGIRHVGAGHDLAEARAHAALEARGVRIALLGITDHPAEYAAGPDRPGVAFADLRHGVPHWLTESIGAVDADVVLVTPHWGPNMTPEPRAYVRAAANVLVDAGTTLVAGHSAHVFHGVERRIVYDLGDYLDDYAVDPDLRNDLGLLFVVTVRGSEPVQIEAFPLKLDFCYTRLAEGEDAAWIARRFRDACRALGTDVRSEQGRLVVSWPEQAMQREPRDGTSPGTSDRGEG